MTKTKKYLLRGLAILVGVMFVFWIAMYIFFVVKKEDIRKQLSVEVGNAVRGEFIVKDLGMNFFSLFPNISLSMKEVELRDSTWNTHKQSLLKAKKILFKVNPFTLISGDISVSKLVIEDAVINLFSDTSGYSNEYLFSPKTNQDKTSKRGFHLEEIGLKNVRIMRSDQVKEKLYDFSFRKLKCELHERSEAIEVETKMDGTIHALAFNLRKGSYAREKSIKGNFTVLFKKDTKQLSFDNIKLAIDKQKFNLSGLFDFSDKKDFRLAISNKKIDFKTAIALLPEKISEKLSRYVLDQLLDVQAKINGKMQFRSLPKVIIDAKVPTGNVKTPVGDFTEMSFTTNFNNAVIDTLPYTDENSTLTFNDVKGKFEGIDIASKKLAISNLINPFLRCDLKSQFDLAALNSLLGSSSFNFVSGRANAEISYAGALMSDTSTRLNGFMSFENGDMVYLPRNVKLQNIDGRLVFDNTDVYIRDLNAEAQGNKVKINASVKNMTTLMGSDPSKLFLDADIVSPSLDIYAFKNMLGTRKKQSVSGKGKFAKLAEKIDRFMDDCSISSRLQASKVKYGNYIATDLSAALSLNANKWTLQKVTFKNSDGSFDLRGTLTSLGNNNNAVEVQTDLNNVNVTKLFTAFNNFGLPSLHAENIKGILTSKATLHAVLDDDTKLVPSSLMGTMDLSLRNGELINFEPIQKMAVFVLKKRDFTKVEFAEIKNTFEIKGQMLTIHKMEIQSNILGLYVEGEYDLQGKNTDLVVQVPLKYLKKREPDYEPENHGLDAKTGISVFVRARSGGNGEIDFKYGLFKKRSVLEKAEKEKEKEARKTTDPLKP